MHRNFATPKWERRESSIGLWGFVKRNTFIVKCISENTRWCEEVQIKELKQCERFVGHIATWSTSESYVQSSTKQIRLGASLLTIGLNMDKVWMLASEAWSLSWLIIMDNKI